MVFKVKTDSSANSAELLGDFTNWENSPIKMDKVSPGLFKCNVKLGAGKHEFKFKVDGMWKENMNDAYATTSNPFGTKNYVIEI